MYAWIRFLFYTHSCTYLGITLHFVVCWYFECFSLSSESSYIPWLWVCLNLLKRRMKPQFKLLQLKRWYCARVMMLIWITLVCIWWELHHHFVHNNTKTMGKHEQTLVIIQCYCNAYVLSSHHRLILLHPLAAWWQLTFLFRYRFFNANVITTKYIIALRCL